jgi:hypothetical protein
MTHRVEPQIERGMRVRTFDGAAFLPAEGESISPRAKIGDYLIEDRGFESSCWIWQRGKDEAGYGKLSPGTKASDQRAHREYYRLACGPIPAGWHVHHRCEQPSCVNPAHLEAKSHSQHLTDHKQADSILAWDDIREMRRLWATAEWTSQRLGERFGVETSMAWRIVDNRNWKDSSYMPPVWERVCPLRECRHTFTTKKPQQRFCCGRHRGMFNSRTPGGYADRRLDREAA